MTITMYSLFHCGKDDCSTQEKPPIRHETKTDTAVHSSLVDSHHPQSRSSSTQQQRFSKWYQCQHLLLFVTLALVLDET